jgi:hypothetical protein
MEMSSSRLPRVREPRPEPPARHRSGSAYRRSIRRFGIFFVDFDQASLLQSRATLQELLKGTTMKYKSLGLTVLLTALAGSALAQTQVSGTLKCGKGGTDYNVEVGDHPGHVLMLTKGACTWTAPLEIAGLKSTAYSGAGTSEIDGPKAQERGYGVITMDNGDKAYARYQDTGTVTEGGKTITFEGTWSFTGGSGKLKGLKGKGTYKGSVVDGEATDQIEGEYSLPGAGATGK